MNVGVLILMVSLSGCAHSQAPELPVGSWEPAETVECPDVLVIEKSGTYAVYNDCYGVNPAVPIIVKGSWRASKTGIVLERHVVNRGAVGAFAENPLLNMQVSDSILWMLDRQGEKIEKFAPVSAKTGF